MRKTYLFFFIDQISEVNAQTQSAAATIGGQIGPIDCRFRRTRIAGGQFRLAPTNSGQGAGEVGPRRGRPELGPSEVGRRTGSRERGRGWGEVGLRRERSRSCGISDPGCRRSGRCRRSDPGGGCGNRCGTESSRLLAAAGRGSSRRTRPEAGSGKAGRGDEAEADEARGEIGLPTERRQPRPGREPAS
jgi:hypothetical protein